MDIAAVDKILLLSVLEKYMAFAFDNYSGLYNNVLVGHEILDLLLWTSALVLSEVLGLLFLLFTKISFEFLTQVLLLNEVLLVFSLPSH